MDNENQKMWEFIHRYLDSCAPVHWLDWVARCGDTQAKIFLESVLFKNGELRDLTNETVKQEVLDAIRQTPSVMEIVIKDFADEVQKEEDKRLTS